MHRSGLALAGAQTTIEAWQRDEVPPVENDGILTAEDVSTLDLQGTWLACIGHKSLEICDRCRLWQRNSPATPENSAAF